MAPQRSSDPRIPLASLEFPPPDRSLVQGREGSPKNAKDGNKDGKAGERKEDRGRKDRRRDVNIS